MKARWLHAIVPTLAALLVVVVTASLGNWQLRRAQFKLDLQAQREAAQAEPAQALGTVPLDEAEVARLEGRHVSATGIWRPEYSVYLDNRAHNGVAGFYLVSPLRLTTAGVGVGAGTGAGANEAAGGDAHEGTAMHVLVVRGWVPRDPRERTRLIAPPVPEGVVTVTGLAQRELSQILELARMAPPAHDQQIWANLTVAGFEQWSGLAAQPLLIRQSAPMTGATPVAPDDLVRDWPAPADDVDMHRGYALQWYSLALTAVVLWAWFVVWRPLRRSRGPAG